MRNGTDTIIAPFWHPLRVDEFSFWCDNSLLHEEKKKSLALFIKHVVSAFR